jgi:anti-anti-sigma regulatory factor
MVLSGEFDLDADDGVDSYRVLDAIDGPMTLDLRNIRLLSGRALKELMHVAKRVGPGKVVLQNATPNVRYIMRIVRLETLFIIK